MSHAATNQRGLPEAWLVVLPALVGALWYLIKATHWLTMVPGDLGDARFNSVILEHFYRWLQGKDGSLWSPNFFYPYADTLAFSDNHFGTAWIYAIARFSGLSREVSFDVWYCVGFLLSYLSCAYAARKFGFSWPSATIAAFIFAFSPIVLAQDTHAQLIYRYAIPLAVLELWQASELRRYDRLPWLGIWLALQFFCSIYLGFFLVMLLGSIAVARIYAPEYSLQSLVPPSSQRNRWLQIGVSALAIALWAALLLMLWKYHFVAKEYRLTHSTTEIRSMLPRIGSYFLADRAGMDAWVGHWVTNIPMRHEQQMFFGLIASGLAIVGATSGRHSKQWARPANIFTLALMALIAITLSVGGFSLYRLFIKLPGFNSLRAVCRISLVMLLPLSWLSAVGIETLTKHFSSWRLQIFLAIAILLTIELFSFKPMHVPITQWRARLSILTKDWKVPAGGEPPILYAIETSPEQWKHIYRELDGMVLSQDLNLPTVNGYSGNLPDDFGSASSCIIGARRLADGVAFRHLPSTELKEMLSRLTVLPANAGCTNNLLSLKPYLGPLSDNVFQNVSLAIINQHIDGSNYITRVEVINRSKSYLPALSTSGQSVQFSWQFVPEGQSPRDDTWTTRAPLEADVPAGATYSQDIRLNLPSGPGRYLLAFSLVQDKVAWFHHKGMSIALGKLPVDVAKAR